jgi:hypothetical protein
VVAATIIYLAHFQETNVAAIGLGIGIERLVEIKQATASTQPMTYIYFDDQQWALAEQKLMTLDRAQLCLADSREQGAADCRCPRGSVVRFNEGGINMTDRIKIALTKGRVEKQTIPLMEAAGFNMAPVRDKQRKLIFDLPDDPYTVILAKGPDVSTYLSQGAVDIGIVGSDILTEQQSQAYELLDLGSASVNSYWHRPPISTPKPPNGR